MLPSLEGVLTPLVGAAIESLEEEEGATATLLSLEATTSAFEKEVEERVGVLRGVLRGVFPFLVIEEGVAVAPCRFPPAFRAGLRWDCVCVRVCVGVPTLFCFCVCVCVGVCAWFVRAGALSTTFPPREGVREGVRHGWDDREERWVWPELEESLARTGRPRLSLCCGWECEERLSLWGGGSEGAGEG